MNLYDNMHSTLENMRMYVHMCGTDMFWMFLAGVEVREGKKANYEKSSLILIFFKLP